MTVRDTDRGYRKVVATLTKRASIKMAIGIQDGDGGSPKGGGPSVADVAAINEARWPVITVYADRRGEDFLRRTAEQISKGAKSGTDIVTTCDAMAQVAAGEMQEQFSNGLGPPGNSEETIARKGSSNPRIDTGQERSSIRGRVI